MRKKTNFVLMEILKKSKTIKAVAQKLEIDNNRFFIEEKRQS